MGGGALVCDHAVPAARVVGGAKHVGCLAETGGCTLGVFAFGGVSMPWWVAQNTGHRGAVF